VLQVSGQRLNGPRFGSPLGDEEGGHEVPWKEVSLGDETS
jgi:hypothetical protein